MTDNKALSFDTLTRLAIEAELMGRGDTMSNLPAEYAGSICIFAELVAAEVRKKDATEPQQAAPAMPSEIALMEKAARRVGITSLLNHGAASCVYSEGCAGVSQEHLLAYTREIALHCAVALAAPQQEVPAQPDDFGSAEHWKEKAQYWAGVAHRLRGEALRGEPVDGIIQPPTTSPHAAQAPQPGYVLVPVEPEQKYLRPFHSCPPDELGLAWQAMVTVARVAAPKAPQQAAPDMEDAQCRSESSEWVPPPSDDGDGSVASMAAPQQEVQAVDDLAKELDTVREALQWYMRRCDHLQRAQHRMRDPERTMVCDILANGSLLFPEGQRYTAQPAPSGDAEQTYEQRRAIRQGHEIAASNAYFEARPDIDSIGRRKTFEAGFERGWDAARKEGPSNV